MGFGTKEIEFGVLKIDGKRVLIYRSPNDYFTIDVGEGIKNVNWSGSEINVTLDSGKVRKYKSPNNYTTI